MEVVITKSKKSNKKLDAIINGSKTVSFGDPSYQDYRQHKDKDRKEAYIARHKKNEDWNASGAKSAGFWSKHILWAKPTLKASIDDINKRFKNLNVKMK